MRARATTGRGVRGGTQSGHAGAGQVVSLPVVVQGPATIKGRHDVRFVVESADGRNSKTVDSSFFGPM